MFLLRNNSLSLNNRLNTFDNDVSPLCTFCRIIDRDTMVQDSFVHFFYNCPVTNNLLFQWTRALVPPPDINTLNFKKLYWYGYDEISNDQTGSLGLVMDIFKYVVWKSKQRRRLPNSIMLSREIGFILDLACAENVSFRHTSSNINLIANLFQARG